MLQAFVITFPLKKNVVSVLQRLLKLLIAERERVSACEVYFSSEKTFDFFGDTIFIAL